MLDDPRIKDIVKEAVRETFLNLGLNVADPDDIIGYQQDMHYVRTMRLRQEMITTKGLLQFVGMVISAIGAAIVLTFFGHNGG